MKTAEKISCSTCGQPFHGLTHCKALDDPNYCPHSATHRHNEKMGNTLKYIPGHGAHLEGVCVHCGAICTAACAIAPVEWK
jgi:hypothetical protein